MLIELPVRLVDKDESEIVGDKNAETMPGSITIRLDCIQTIFENGDTGTCILEASNGTTYMILMPYSIVRKLWHKAIMTSNGTFLLSYLSESVKKECDTEEKMVISKEESCDNCGGLNFKVTGETNSPDNKTVSKKCLDCGVIKEIKI